MAARRPAIPTIPFTMSCSGCEHDRSVVGWAKALLAPCPPLVRSSYDGGHAALCPPFASCNDGRQGNAPVTTKPKAVAVGGIAAGQCLRGRVGFEIDTPARWAWHDHSAASRRAHGAAYATYVGSWRRRSRITKGGAPFTRFEAKPSKPVPSFSGRWGRRRG